MRKPAQRAGTVAVIGRPNAGKSTLVNALVGTKVAIVSDKPQTTRRRVLGIWSSDEGQIVFVDTPGLHKPLHRLNKVMLEEALEAIEQVDLRLLVIDALAPPGKGDEYVLDLLSRSPAPAHRPPEQDRQRRQAAAAPSPREARTDGPLRGDRPGLGADRGRADATPAAPPVLSAGGRRPVPAADGDDDRPDAFTIAEVIREKFLERTRDEIPYGFGVVIEDIGRDEAKNLTVVMATIVVDKENHKRIVVGAGRPPVP